MLCLYEESTQIQAKSHLLLSSGKGCELSATLQSETCADVLKIVLQM